MEDHFATLVRKSHFAIKQRLAPIRQREVTNDIHKIKMNSHSIYSLRITKQISDSKFPLNTLDPQVYEISYKHDRFYSVSVVKLTITWQQEYFAAYKVVK